MHQNKDSLWSVDLFRCESLILRTHWVMVVMDQFTRRIIGFGVQAGALDGPAICRMFNHAIAGALTPPRHLSSDHDPLFEFHRWKANLRILDVTEIKTVPEVPLSHPFIERLVGTIRREFWIQSLFGAPEISNGSCCTSGTTTTEIGFMRRWAASLRTAKPAMSIAGLSASVSISGSLTAAACISYPWLPDPQFATDRSRTSDQMSVEMPRTCDLRIRLPDVAECDTGDEAEVITKGANARFLEVAFGENGHGQRRVGQGKVAARRGHDDFFESLRRFLAGGTCRAAAAGPPKEHHSPTRCPLPTTAPTWCAGHPHAAPYRVRA